MPAVAFYVAWMILYYVWVFLVRGRRAERRGYETLFSYLMTLPFVNTLLNLLGAKATKATLKVKDKVLHSAGQEPTEEHEESRYHSLLTKAIYLMLHYTF